MKYKRFRESGKETKSGDRGEEACLTEMSHSGGSEEGLIPQQIKGFERIISRSLFTIA